MAVPFQDGLSQFFDDSGNPLAGGLVYTYAAGTTTPVATYTTRAGTVEHDNPVTLDSAGRVSIWLDRSTAYRFDIKSADDVLIDSVDNVRCTDGSAPAYEVERFTATEGQTVINLAGSYTPGINSLSVYVGDGGALYLSPVVDYTETSESVITLSSALAEGETVTVIYGNSVSISSVLASEVSFQPLPAGAPARSVQSKLRDFYSIMDGGAIADGVADDAAAIALAEASDYSHVDLCGKTVYTSGLVTDLTKNYFNGTLYALNSNGFRTHVKPRSPVRGVGLDRSRQTKSTVLEWDGLNVLWLGTSIPQEAGDEGLETAYPMLFGAALGCTVSNMAWAGSHANFDYSDDPFEGSTVKALSMTEADRLAGLAEFGASSAYDDSFNAITIASQMTCDYRIRQQFQSTDFDVVILDHNHNDARANPGTLDPETVTVTGITKGSTTTFTLSSIGTIAVGDGVGWITSGITKLGYGSARVQTVVGNVITVDIDSSAYLGTFSSGVLSKLDRATVYGAWDFVILSIYQAALEADAEAPKIILSSAPSNYTNLIANDSIYSNSQYVYDVAEKWGLGFFDVLDSLNIQEFDHLNYLADTVHPTALGARQAIANHWVAWASGGVGRISNPDDFLARGPGTVLENQREALYSKFLDGFGTPSTILSADTLVLDEDFSAGLGAYTLVGTTVPVVVTAPWTVDNAIECVSNSSNSSSYIQRTLTMDKGVSVEFDVWLPVVENLSPTASSKVMYLMTLREAAGLHYSVGLVVRSSGVTIRAVYFETPGAGLVGVSSTKRLLAGTKYRIKLEVAQETGVLLYVDGVVVAGPVVPADPTHATPTTLILGNHNGNIGGAFTSYIGNVTVNRQSVLDYSLRHTGPVTSGSELTVINGVITAATATQTVNVKDSVYGAVGDGVTDDSAAITAALAAATSIGCETFFPPGTYLCGSQIVVHRQKVRGDGATLKFSGLGASTDCVILQGSTSETPLIWDGIDIDANNTGRDAMVLSGGKVGSTQADYLRVFSCRITSAVRDGIHIEPGAAFCWLEDFRFQDVRVSDPGRHGVAIILPNLSSVFANQGTFDNFECRGAGRLSTGCDIYCDVIATTSFSKVAELTFIGCQIDALGAANHAQASIQLNNTGGSGGNYDGWVFIGCTIEDTGSVITGFPTVVEINGGAVVKGMTWLGGVIVDYGNLVDLSDVTGHCFVKEATTSRNQQLLESDEKLQWDASGVATLQYGGQTGQVKTAGVFLADDGFREGRNVLTNTAGAITASKGYNKLTLTANVTSITFPTGTADELDGQIISFVFTQDATGGRTVAGWPAAVLLSGGALTVTSTALKSSHIRFQYERGEAKWFEISRSLNM